LQVDDAGFIDLAIPASLPPTFFAKYPWVITFLMTLFLVSVALVKRPRI
jgi:hypothetical protein